MKVTCGKCHCRNDTQLNCDIYALDVWFGARRTKVRTKDILLRCHRATQHAKRSQMKNNNEDSEQQNKMRIELTRNGIGVGAVSQARTSHNSGEKQNSFCIRNDDKRKLLLLIMNINGNHVAMCRVTSSFLSYHNARKAHRP